MKESNFLDPKMEVYYKMVRHLEDKFDGLELNHIARKYNEAADELAKMASARTPVPPNVFARDLQAIRRLRLGDRRGPIGRAHRRA